MATQNTLFAILTVSEPAALEEQLKAASPWIYQKLSDAEWLLYTPSATTAKEVSDKLGFSGPGTGTAIVVKVDSYFGRSYQTTWDWIRTKQGAELVSTASILQQG
jgi:hypothetical protein